MGGGQGQSSWGGGVSQSSRGGGGWVSQREGGSVRSVSRGVEGGVGSAKIEQQNEYSLLHGGRYASCVHAGGLSCSKSFSFVLFVISKKFLLYFANDNFGQKQLSAVCVVTHVELHLGAHCVTNELGA